MDHLTTAADVRRVLGALRREFDGDLERVRDLVDVRAREAEIEELTGDLDA